MQIEQIDKDAAEEEAYELGRRDGWSEAVQHIDCLTGGDGEYYASTIPGRGCETPAQMVAGIAERFASLSARPAVGEDVVAALSQAIPVEIKDDAGWSLSFNFGRGEAARDKMRAVADALRAYPSVCPVCNGDCASANPPVNFCPMKDHP